MNQTAFQKERNDLVNTLISSGHLKPGSLLEAAMRRVQRHVLIPNLLNSLDAYHNKTLVFKRDDDGSILGTGRTLCSSTMPGLVASILQHAEITPGLRILEVGTSSGYTTAVMAEIVGTDGQIISIEIDEETARLSRTALNSLGYSNIAVIAADGWLGYAEKRPYDRIIVTAACVDVSPFWIDQLAEGGHLMVPLSFSRRGGLYPFIRFTRSTKEVCGTVAPSLVAVGFVPIYGPHIPRPLEYDSGMTSAIEKQLPKVLLQKHPTDRGIMRSAALFAEVQLAVLAEQAIPFDPEDIKLAKRIVDQWEAYERPKPQDFVFCLISGTVDSSEFQWRFSKISFDLGIRIEPGKCL